MKKEYNVNIFLIKVFIFINFRVLSQMYKILKIFFFLSLFFYFPNNISKKVNAEERNIIISNSYIPIFFENQDPLSAYFTIKNLYNEDIKILSIETNIGFASFHKSEVDKDGISKMISLPFIEMKANSELQFEPASYHIMISNINYPILKNNNYLNITFMTNNKKNIVVPFKIIYKNKKNEEMHKH